MPKEQGFSVPRAEEKDSPFIRILPGLFFPRYLNLLFALLSFSRLRSEAVCVCVEKWGGLPGTWDPLTHAHYNSLNSDASRGRGSH